MHHSGKEGPNKKRPVIVKLLYERIKIALLKTAKKDGLLDKEGSSRELGEVNKKLWDSAKLNRENIDKVPLSFKKLLVNNHFYIRNDKKLQARNKEAQKTAEKLTRE